MACYRGECYQKHPVFPTGSQATCKENAKPADMHAPDIQYTEEDDRAIDEFTRKVVGTSWHSVRPLCHSITSVFCAHEHWNGLAL